MTSSKITVLFSRPKEKLAEAINVLPATRFNLVSCPTITIGPVETYNEIDQAFSDLTSFDYLIFTSQYAVANTMNYLKRLGMSPAALQHLTICTVGPIVSQKLNEFNLNSQIMPQAYTASSLCDLLPSVRRNSKRVLFPKGNRALGVLERSLGMKGYDVAAPIVYRTEFRQDLACAIDAMNPLEPPDCIALTSPSSVMSLANALKEKGKTAFTKKAVICAIGPRTQKACSEVGWAVQILPIEYTVQSMARAIFRHFQRNPKPTH